jgi:3-methyladenine DNA glycosylase/8-oxoguanine DNA glycosylase
MRLELAAKPPFSLYSVIHSHGWAGLAPFTLDEENNEFSYILALENQRVIELIFEEIAEGVSVEISGPVDDTEEKEISDVVTWMLGLDQDFTEFYALVKGEPNLQNIEANAQGRILRSPTLYEDTIKTILTTNTAWSGTIRMVDVVVEQFGMSLPGSNSKKAFPDPAAIAATDEMTLREKTRLGYRSPYILNLSREIASGNLELESLKRTNLPVEEVRKILLSIKGVGSYAAANLLILLGYYNYLTIDSWALKMVSHEWYGGDPITPTEVEKAFEKWGEWKGLAYWLWDWSYGKG